MSIRKLAGHLIRKCFCFRRRHMYTSKDTTLVVQELNDSVEALKKGSARRHPENGRTEVDYSPAVLIDFVENFLRAVFETKVNRNKLSGQQRKEVDKLISEIKTKDTAEVIDNAVFRLGHKFSFDSGPDYLILRSGLQFILDGKGEGGEDLTNTLKFSIDTLDKGINNWKNGDVVTEESVAYSYEDLCRPPNVPESHHWWWC